MEQMSGQGLNHWPVPPPLPAPRVQLATSFDRIVPSGRRRASRIHAPRRRDRRLARGAFPADAGRCRRLPFALERPVSVSHTHVGIRSASEG
jgi:hypothetical protein